LLSWRGGGGGGKASATSQSGAGKISVEPSIQQ